MGLNAALVAAIFTAAALGSRHPPVWLQQFHFSTEAIKAILWFTAMILSLPLLIATFRKLQAFGMLIAETRVTRAKAGARTRAIREVVAQTVVIIGVLVLILYVFVLSSTLLPSLKVLMILLAIVALVTVLLWRSFIKIYSQAQVALSETLSQPPAPRPLAASQHLPGLLGEADLEAMQIVSSSPAAGKLIRELELRTRTGASIVGIERTGDIRIINPGPDEELQTGDQLLLLGTRKQLDSAKSALSKQT